MFTSISTFRGLQCAWTDKRTSGELIAYWVNILTKKWKNKYILKSVNIQSLGTQIQNY